MNTIPIRILISVIWVFPLMFIVSCKHNISHEDKSRLTTHEDIPRSNSTDLNRILEYKAGVVKHFKNEIESDSVEIDTTSRKFILFGKGHHKNIIIHGGYSDAPRTIDNPYEITLIIDK